jgi:hypothetical protein
MAWIELGMQTVFITAPHGGPQIDEPYEEPEPCPLPDAVHVGSFGGATYTEPAMRAVNGWVVVSYLHGPPHRHYVARDPDFIAEQLLLAIAAGKPYYRYWSRPGERDSALVHIACALVTDVRVEHLEPDLDALYDDIDAYLS